MLRRLLTLIVVLVLLALALRWARSREETSQAEQRASPATITNADVELLREQNAQLRAEAELLKAEIELLRAELEQRSR